MGIRRNNKSSKAATLIQAQAEKDEEHPSPPRVPRRRKVIRRGKVEWIRKVTMRGKVEWRRQMTRRGRGQGKTAVRPPRTPTSRKTDMTVAPVTTPSAIPPQNLLPPMPMIAANPGAPNALIENMEQLNKMFHIINDWEQEKINSITNLVSQIRTID